MKPEHKAAIIAYTNEKLDKTVPTSDVVVSTADGKLGKSAPAAPKKPVVDVKKAK